MALGERIGRASAAGTVIALRGGLAAGKTTLAKGIARGLGIEEEITSPTFTLLNEYPGAKPFFHMDAYRLSGPEDFRALGSDEVLYGKGVSAVEWSERVEEALPEDRSVVLIEALGGGERRISLSGPLEEALG
jgi:tRNA threonylcarbamoyladenosine biosynthesis protein TsaE